MRYKLSWKWWTFTSKVRHLKFNLKHDTCWHFWLWQKGLGPWCIICWLKHEMLTMLREEENKQILWGDGGSANDSNVC